MKKSILAMSLAAVTAAATTGCGRCCRCCCEGKSSNGEAKVRLITLAPGHFHAALVQNRSYPEVSKDVRVFAPEGPEVESHLKLVEAFNSREKDPTAWNEIVYRGADFLERALSTSNGNVVVLAGRNCDKTEYVHRCVEAGLNVFSDKPMAITPDRFDRLEDAFAIAGKKGLHIYDIMTERFEATTALQRELARDPAVYGEQEKGTAEDPAVTKESVHHFCKLVNGKPLQRPGWYYDTDQQGEAIMDVTTHLVDLVQWETFPDTILAKDDVEMVSARIWPTAITAADYRLSTGLDSWPKFLEKDLDANGVLQCRANGEFVYRLKGVNARVSVLWNFMPPEGGGDTHHSLMRGTKSELIIRQNAKTGFRQRLFVKPRRAEDTAAVGEALEAALAKLSARYAGLSCTLEDGEWRVNVPKEHDIGHEAHFSQVTRNFIRYFTAEGFPAWEKPNMLVKYYTLKKAYEAAHAAK